MRFIDREGARNKGWNRYRLRRPCPKGHFSERYTLTGQCIECGRNLARAYYQKHKTRLYLHSLAKQRARAKQKTPRWANRAAILAIYAECRKVSFETGIKHHVDHIIPLNGRRVSGLHVEYNLQIIPAAENFRKTNHHWIV